LNHIKDEHEQQTQLEQIFHLGQTPSQLFKTRHPEKQRKPVDDKFKNYIVPD
jgi:hypothetical protein